MTQYQRRDCERIQQGDILRDVEFVEDIFYVDDIGTLGAVYITFPYVVVLSQDCDLLWDHETRKRLAETASPTGSTNSLVESILVCPAYDRDLFVAGTHLLEIGLPNMQTWSTKPGSSPWRLVQHNGDKRYHFLSGSEGIGIGEMVLDFKHIFTVARHKLYAQYPSNYVGSIGELYRAQISHRFAHYLSRIGLPDEQ